MSLTMASSALDCERDAIYSLQLFLRSGYINDWLSEVGDNEGEGGRLTRTISYPMPGQTDVRPRFSQTQ